MAIGTVVMVLTAALVNHLAVVEARSIQENLARSQAYWAAMGHVSYGLSRARNQDLCHGDCIDDGARVAAVQGFVNELMSPDVPSGDRRRWRYGELHADHYIDVRADIFEDDDPAKHPKSGHLFMEVTFPSDAQSALDFLKNFSQRLRPVEVRFCVGMAGNTCNPIGSALTNPNASGISLIKAVRRPPA